MPHFTEDWLCAHIPHWEALFFEVLGWDHTVPRLAVEIGSFEGRSSLWLLDNLLRHADSRLVCIDTFAGGAEHTAEQVAGLYDRFRGNLAASPHAAKAEVLRTESFTGLGTLIARGERGADLVYVDGSHAAPDVLADLVLAFRLLAPGGVILCDDYFWAQGDPVDVLAGPKLAIDAFTNIYRRRIEFVPWDYHWQRAFRKSA